MGLLRLVGMALLLALSDPRAVLAQPSARPAVGTISGSFDVTLSGSASYVVPIKTAPGTAGTEPKISLVYDSQAASGPLGAGWAISGLSTITRGPKNARFDGMPDGVKMAETDALYLDGARLVAISSTGSGATRQIEYRKDVDDQTRIFEYGADFNSAKFVVNTKGGLRIDFLVSPDQSVDQNRGDIKFNDNSVLLRAESRVADSTENYIDFYYHVNGSGNYDIKSIHYTGHEDKSGDRKPYAIIDFNYEQAPRATQTFVAGKTLSQDTRLIGIVSRVSPVPEDAATVAWTQVARYSFDFESRDTANRFVLKTIHQYGEDDAQLTPTTFSYSTPTIGWADATGYNFPAILAEHEEIGAAYRFAHFSATPNGLPDLLFASASGGSVESFSFTNQGTSWTRVDGFKSPVAFNSADGSDLGVIIADVNGDGRADLMQSYQTGSQSPAVASYTAGSSQFDPQPGYNLPFVVSRDGKVVAQYRLERWSGGSAPDLIYQSGTDQGFLLNTGTGWRPMTDAGYLPPLKLGNRTWTIDADCSGRPALMGETADSAGHPVWKTYRVGAHGWEDMGAQFAPPIPVSMDPEAIRLITVDNTKCQGILVATAQNGGIHVVYQASSTGWQAIASKAPNFDLVDAAGVPSHALVATVGKLGLSDVFANQIMPDGHSLKFMYFQTATNWQKAPDDYAIPVLSGGDHPPNPVVADFDGDGRTDIVFPADSRQRFGQIFLASDQGFVEKVDNLPPVFFAKKDQQDLGVRMVDLNGDGLVDLLESRAGNEVGAWINNGPIGTADCGKGWCPSAGLKPPLPFAGDDITGNPVQFVDVDGDGYIDLLYSYKGKDGKVEAHLFRNVDAGGGARKWRDVSTGSQSLSGLAPPTLPGDSQPYPFSAYKIGDLGVRFVDVAGKGRPYMLIGFQPGGVGTTPILKSFKNDGTKWVPDSAFVPPVPFAAQVGTVNDPSHDLGVQIIDINGDGLPDIVAKYRDPQDPSKIVEGVWLNTGNGWTKDSSISVPVALDGLLWDPTTGLKWDKNANVQWTDLNGDGIPDIVYTAREGATNRSVTYLGTGRGWVAKPEWQVPSDALADRNGDSGLRIVDVNGDGYPDLVYARTDGDGSTKKGLYVNTGAGWLVQDSSLVPDLPLVDKDGNDQGVRLYDTDGNGLLDFIQAYRGDSLLAAVKLNQGRRSDVIHGINPGDGLETKIYYQTFLEPDVANLGPNPVNPKLRWPRVYEPSGASGGYPILAPVPATYAVRRASITDGPGRQLGFSYRYGGYRMDALAKRSLGFAWRESLNEVNGIITHLDFSQDLKKAGKSLNEATCWVNSDLKPIGVGLSSNICPGAAKNGSAWVKLLTENDNTWNVEEANFGGGSLPQRPIRQISLTSTTSTTYELDGQRIEWHTDSFTYDEPAAPQSLLDRRLNVLGTRTARGDGSSVATVNEYGADDSVRWFFGRLTKSTVTKTGATATSSRTQPPPEKRVAVFGYDPLTGLLTSETANAGTAKESKTTYKRDPYGNIISRKTSGVGIPDQDPWFIGFDDLGRFPRLESNPLHQTSSRQLSITTGQPVTVTDLNGVTSSYEYDGFGRVRAVHAPTDPTAPLTTTTDYLPLSALDANVPSSGVSAAYAVKTQVVAGTQSLPPSYQLLDAKGRVLRTVGEGFTANDDPTSHRWIVRDFAFDILGQPSSSTLPYEAGQHVSWISVQRDVLGRVTTSKSADGAVRHWDYAGRPTGGTVTTQTDPLGNSTVTTTNMRQIPVMVVDARGGKVSYEYDAGDRPIKVTDPIGAVTSYAYDDAGNRKDVSDPDLGKWHYEYDSLGRLSTQIDVTTGNEQVSSIDYDALGRVITERRPEHNWTWEYDTAPHGVGKLAVLKDDANTYVERHSYDSLGRHDGISTTIGATSFASGQNFDKFSRIDSIYYPEGFTAQNIYDSKGFLKNVVDQAAPQHPLWTVKETDVFGHVTKQVLGNGVQQSNVYDQFTGRPSSIDAATTANTKILALKLKYDLAGNLLHREEDVQAKSEDFAYDELNRLTSWTKKPGQQETYSYDAGGRITFKSDVGKFDYADDLPAVPNVGDANPPRHGVVKTSLGGTEINYAYDAHGNMIKNGADVYAYSSDNRLVSARLDPDNIRDHWVTFDYDPGGNRFRELARHGLRTIETLSVGNYERVTEFGMFADTGLARFVRHRWYVAGGDGVFAVVEKNTEVADWVPGTIFHQGAVHAPSFPFPVRKVWYLHKDQLGSVIAISDDSGQVRARYWYSPWGERDGAATDPRNKKLTSGQRLEDSWSKGFIGQEHFDEFDLVHLNGRVYSPKLGRFISADPVNQAPLDTQVWDAYSYARNNPLRNVDPSGYSWLGDVGNAIGNAAGGAWNAVKGAATAVYNVAAQGVTAYVNLYAEAGKWVSENWRQIVIVAAVVAVTYFTGGIGSGVAIDLGTAVLSGMAAGATAGALGPALYGGSFEDVLSGAVKGGVIGAFSGAAFYGVGSAFSGGGTLNDVGGVAGHGLVGGAEEAAEGGNFWRGFASGSVTKASSEFGPSFDNYGLDAARAAVVGGTVASINGGTFANGAVTGVFSYTFNDYAHSLALQGAGAGAFAGAVLVPAGCEVATVGACSVALPGMVEAGALGGAAAGGALGWVVGSAADSWSNFFSERQTPDQEALKDIIQDATSGGRRPLTNSDADQVLEWGKEVGTPVRDDRDTDHWTGGPHIHVPGSGINHIPVEGAKP